MCGTARERLNSDGPRSRTQIEKPRAFDSRREHIEQSLAQTVGRRPRAIRRRALQFSAAISSSDHAHKSSADYADYTEKRSATKKHKRHKTFLRFCAFCAFFVAILSSQRLPNHRQLQTRIVLHALD